MPRTGGVTIASDASTAEPGPPIEPLLEEGDPAPATKTAPKAASTPLWLMSAVKLADREALLAALDNSHLGARCNFDPPSASFKDAARCCAYLARDCSTGLQHRRVAQIPQPTTVVQNMATATMTQHPSVLAKARTLFAALCPALGSRQPVTATFSTSASARPPGMSGLAGTGAGTSTLSQSPLPSQPSPHPPARTMPRRAFVRFFGAALRTVSHGVLPQECVDAVVEYEWRAMRSVDGAGAAPPSGPYAASFPAFLNRLVAFCLFFCSVGFAYASPLVDHVLSLITALAAAAAPAPVALAADSAAAESPAAEDTEGGAPQATDPDLEAVVPGNGSLGASATLPSVKTAAPDYSRFPPLQPAAHTLTSSHGGTVALTPRSGPGTPRSTWTSLNPNPNAVRDGAVGRSVTSGSRLAATVGKAPAPSSGATPGSATAGTAALRHLVGMLERYPKANAVSLDLDGAHGRPQGSVKASGGGVSAMTQNQRLMRKKRAQPPQDQRWAIVQKKAEEERIAQMAALSVPPSRPA